MEYFYKKEIESLTCDCPPLDYNTLSQECFRWVFNDIGDKKNFKAQADKSPKIINNKSDIEKCEYFALSFHNSEETSRKAFNYFAGIVSNAYKRLGTHIAKGKLTIDDGVGSGIDKNGHFNFHHVKKHGFEKKFIIISKL